MYYKISNVTYRNRRYFTQPEFDAVHWSRRIRASNSDPVNVKRIDSKPPGQVNCIKHLQLPAGQPTPVCKTKIVRKNPKKGPKRIYYLGYIF